MKPMLATDWDENKVKFPCILQPKIDGVRGLNLFGKMTGRSLKSFGNKHITSFYSNSLLLGFDGELAAQAETHPDLCRITTSATSTIDGEPYTLWHLFDYCTPEVAAKPFIERYLLLDEKVATLKARGEYKHISERLRLVPCVKADDMDELLHWDTLWLEMGYEGTIIRAPKAPYKFGRSTVNEGYLLRIKRFIEEEARVDYIEEGQSNLNEQTQNELGYSTRSSHQENMIPNGQVGCLICTDLKTGNPIRVSPGKMPHDDRIKFWNTPELILGKVIKYKHFPKGVKDKPRFANFQSFRDPADMSE